MRWNNNKLRAFFLQQALWLFVAVLLLFSYVFMQLAHDLSWAMFGGLFLGLGLFFLPLLVFVYWRQRPGFSIQLRQVGWLVVFVLLPGALTLLWAAQLTDLPGVPKQTALTDAVNRYGLLIAWLALLSLEGLLQWDQRRQTRRTANWLLGLNIRRLAIAIVALFALTIVPASNYFTEYTRPLNQVQTLLFYLSAAGQTFLIYLSYYLIYYVHHHFLFNELLRKKGLLYYLLGTVGFLLLFVPVQSEFIRLFPAVSQIKIHPLGVVPEVFADLSFTLPLAFFLLNLPFIIIIEWYRQAQALSTLEKEKTVTELQLLKQQINPHFFFNTLNNLYAMSLTHEEETPEVILQLSELMRYVIYKGQEEQVPLKLEVKYLQDYLNLQQLRLHQTLDIQFTVDLADEEDMVPPLLFIILVENAFKHGIEPAGEPGFLHLHLQQTDHQLLFRCHNSREKTRTAEVSGGLGLKNLRRRLSVRFPDRHQLRLQESEQDFLAELSLTL